MKGAEDRSPYRRATYEEGERGDDAEQTERGSHDARSQVAHQKPVGSDVLRVALEVGVVVGLVRERAERQ